MPLLLKKYPKAPPSQSYPDDKLLAADVKTLTESVRNKSDAVTDLVLGQACGNALPLAEKALRKARAQLVKLLPDGALAGEVVAKMAKLKRNSRILQKAVHYAACSKVQAKTPQLQDVRDILRATISFPESYFQIEDIGSKMIDILDRTFERGVVFVKNRFVESRYPRLIDYSGRKMTDSLRDDIISLANDNLSGRDTFYRDLQVLIRLDKEHFPNGTSMRDVLFEVQLVSNRLHLAKATANENGGVSGHDMYKVIRAVMEYAEYMYWKEHAKPRRKFLLPDVDDFYPRPDAGDFERFTEYLDRMWKMYLHASPAYVKHMQEAIENSAWYARVSQQQR